MTRGVFIAFEGGEGSGKTTQVDRLAYHLIEAGHTVTVTREPGGTPVGGKIRQLVLDPEARLPAHAEALLMAADRAIHAEQIIRPALDRGDIVISDRYWDSSIAYQGHARGLGAGYVGWISEWATQHLAPDLVLLLDIDPEVGLARARERNLMESQPLAFHQRVRSGFLRRAGGGGYPWQVILADQSADIIAAIVAGRVAQLLEDHAAGRTAGPVAPVIALEDRRDRNTGCSTSR